MLLGSIISEVSCFNGYGHLSFETKLEASCNFKGFSSLLDTNRNYIRVLLDITDL